MDELINFKGYCGQTGMVDTADLGIILSTCGDDSAKRNEFVSGIRIGLCDKMEEEFDLSGLNLLPSEWDVLLETNHPSVKSAATENRTDARSVTYGATIGDPRFEEVKDTRLNVSFADYNSDVIVMQHRAAQDEVLILSTNSQIVFDAKSACCLMSDSLPISSEVMVCKKHSLHIILRLIAEEYCLIS